MKERRISVASSRWPGGTRGVAWVPTALFVLAWAGAAEGGELQGGPPVGTPAVDVRDSGSSGPDASSDGDRSVGESGAEDRESPRYPGSIREGVLEMRERSEEGEAEEALELADAMLRPTALLRWRSEFEETTHGWSERLLSPVDPALEALGWNGPPESLRAEVHYAEGQVHAQGADLEAAEQALGRAAALAGSGSLRLDALYERGTLRLEAAESVRLSIPEVAEELGLAAPPTAPPQPVPPPSGAPDEEAPDPLDLARALYLAARDGLLERLRADWRDQGTRANLEWIQRRLRELDEIEREREEQEPEQDPQEQNQDQEQEQDPDSQDPQEENSEQDQEREPEDEQERNQDPDGEDESEDESDEGELEPVEEPPEPEPSEENEETQEPELPEDAKEAEEPVLPEGARQEEHLTREEVLRLLEQLQAIEEEAEAVRQQLIQNRRKPVQRDW